MQRREIHSGLEVLDNVIVDHCCLSQLWPTMNDSVAHCINPASGTDRRYDVVESIRGIPPLNVLVND